MIIRRLLYAWELYGTVSGDSYEPLTWRDAWRVSGQIYGSWWGR